MDELNNFTGTVSRIINANDTDINTAEEVKVSGYYLEYEDILFFKFREDLVFSKTKQIADRVLVDFDENDIAISLEIIKASLCSSKQIEEYLELVGYYRN